MPQQISLSYLEGLLFPLGFKLDRAQEYPIFWRKVKQNDSRSPYAFSILTATLHEYSFRLEGLNEPRFIKLLRAGKIQIEKEEDIEDYREVLFEATLEDSGRLEPTLNFLLDQIALIEQHPIHTDEYATALKNIKLIVDAANQLDME
jgi:hypothetical protein